MNGYGSINVTNGVYLGYGALSAGILEINGGSMTVNKTGNLAFDVGGQGHGEVNMTGGTLTLLGRLNLSHFAGSTGHVQLDGGVLDVNDIVLWNGTGTMDITGGTMLVGSSRMGRLNVYVNAGSLTGYGDPGNVVLTDLGNGITEVTAIPEPASLALAAFGVLALLRRRR